MKIRRNLFDVVVIATMSAGKSTVINALIGHELLHSANEATTATITRIHDQDHLPFFSGHAYSYNNELIEEAEQIDSEIMRKWNADKNIKFIDITGDIQTLHNDENEIVIYDTPGPNNSQDNSHESLTMEVINDGNFGLILYVLNATQLGVNDDHKLLEKIHQSLSQKQDKEIIFLLNKSDMLDPEKGETIDSVIEKTENYLTNIGFKNPIIIPTAANQALVCQKVLNREKLTRSQFYDLKNLISSEKNDFLIKSLIPFQIKQKALKKIKKGSKKKRHYYTVRNDLKISNLRLLKNYIRSGFGIVSIILQEKLGKQATSNKQQATSNKQQATSNKQQATSNKQQATSY